jgi:hypothetical protein
MAQRTVQHTSARLAEAIADAIADNRAAADGRSVRRDGWTAERIRIFLQLLADGGSVTRAANAAGASARSAYNLRRRARGFERAWTIALEIARPTPAFRSCVLPGRIDIIHRNGKVWGERHRPDNRRDMATLRRLDLQAKAAAERGDPMAEADFEALVDHACAQASLPRSAEKTPEACPCRELNNEESGEPGVDPQPGEVSAVQAPAASPAAHLRAIARRDRHFREIGAITPGGRRNPGAARRRESIIRADGNRSNHNLKFSIAPASQGGRRHEIATGGSEFAQHRHRLCRPKRPDPRDP